MALCASCGARFSNWDEGCLLLFQTRSGQHDKFDLRSCALGQGAFANTVLVGPIWRWNVFPGLPDASARNEDETRSEVIGRTVKDRDRGGAIFTTPRSTKHRFATDGPVPVKAPPTPHGVSSLMPPPPPPSEPRVFTLASPGPPPYGTAELGATCSEFCSR